MTRPRTATATVLAVAAVLAGCGDGGGGPAAGPSPTQRAAPSPTPAATQSRTATGTETGTATATETGTATGTATASPTGSIGGLAAGFPVDIVPVPPGAEVKVSTTAPASEGRLQLSLGGQTAAPADTVLQFYREALLPQGFVESPAAGLPAGVVGGVFARSDGSEVLTVVVSPLEAAQQFSVGGVVATG